MRSYVVEYLHLSCECFNIWCLFLHNVKGNKLMVWHYYVRWKRCLSLVFEIILCDKKTVWWFKHSYIFVRVYVFFSLGTMWLFRITLSYPNRWFLKMQFKTVLAVTFICLVSGFSVIPTAMHICELFCFERSKMMSLLVHWNWFSVLIIPFLIWIRIVGSVNNHVYDW